MVNVKRKLRHPIFLGLHLCAVLLAVALPWLWKLTQSLPGIFSDCLMLRWLFLYCPLCGGTRAVMALLRLDVVSAFCYNAFVTVMAFVILTLDVVAWVRYFQKKDVLLRLPKWSWITASAILLAYWILRNYLVIVHGIDPTGDLAPFWVAIRAYFAA